MLDDQLEPAHSADPATLGAERDTIAAFSRLTRLAGLTIVSVSLLVAVGMVLRNLPISGPAKFGASMTTSYLHQNWQLFAPDPPTGHTEMYIQVIRRSDSDATRIATYSLNELMSRTTPRNPLFTSFSGRQLQECASVLMESKVSRRPIEADRQMLTQNVLLWAWRHIAPSDTAPPPMRLVVVSERETTGSARSLIPVRYTGAWIQPSGRSK